MRLKNLIVALDAGHGGHDPGANKPYQHHSEAYYNARVVEQLRELLMDAGAWPMTLRWDRRHKRVKVEQYTTLGERVRRINRFRAVDGRPVQLVISVHHNAVDNRAVAGSEVLYYPGSEAGKIVASSILGCFLSPFLPRRRIVKRPDLCILRETVMPAVLTEAAFLSNGIQESKVSCAQTWRQEALDILRGLATAEVEL